MQANRISFIERKISYNAVFTTLLGGALLAVHLVMIFFSVIEKGNLPFYSGVVESFLLLFSIFGLLWAILHYDEEKTQEKFKILGIVLNAIALVIGILVMAVGFFSY